ncbi:hypothetical protein [Marinomonas transparens]|uniref:Uncharacterized protein n=1 Tax=Marinomonas transparens TaxID=2795388 RepID=A0A934N899_9GAMM|nr:hypothetical protein [Marinomonas transparens]MBJ7539861.1 hypothetical protein [Marinomonas transparens]
MPEEMISFKLKFETPEDIDGKPTHQIDAETLGESLTELSGLLRNSLKTLQGESASAKLDVKANNEGSFVVDFVAFLSSGGIDMLKTLGITTSSLAITGASIFSLLKQIGNRKITKKVFNDDTSVSLILDDGQKIDCSEDVAKLMDSYSVRKSIENLVSKPVNSGKANGISFLDEGDKVTTTLSKEELSSFKAPAKKSFTEEKESVIRVEIAFEVIDFTKGTGWKILFDNQSIPVRINDKSFLERVGSSKREFKKGQTFQVDLKTTEKLVEGKTTITYSIDQVL